MDNQTMVERFEEAFLAGRSRDDIMVSSCLHRGADGEYFNPNTRLAFAWFLNGADSVVVDLSGARADLHDGGSYFYACAVEEAIEAAGGTVKS